MAKVAAMAMPRGAAVNSKGRRQEGMQTGWAEHHGSLDCALRYLGFVWSEFPGYFPQGTSQSGKEPHGQVTWADFQRNAPNDAAIRGWFDLWPGSGVTMLAADVANLMILRKPALGGNSGTPCASRGRADMTRILTRLKGWVGKPSATVPQAFCEDL